jgi:hypothetical protein
MAKIELQLDVSSARETVQRILDALSMLHIACGGTGLPLNPDAQAAARRRPRSVRIQISAPTAAAAQGEVGQDADES